MNRNPFRAVCVLALVLAGPLAFAGSNESIDVVSDFNVVEGRVGVEFELESEDFAVYDLIVEYEIGGSGFFQPATEAPGSGGTRNLASSNDGVRHIFVWDVVTDVGRTELDSVTLRLRASDGTPPTLTDDTDDFEVDTYVLRRRIRGSLRDARTGSDISTPFSVTAFSSVDGRRLGNAAINSGFYSVQTGTLEPVDLVVERPGYETLRISRLLPPLDLPLYLEPNVPESPDITSLAPGADQLQVRWEAAPEDNLAGYNIYRSRGEGFQKLNEFPVIGTVYEDTEIFIVPQKGNGLTTYAVTAEHVNGNESPLDSTSEVSTSELVVWIPDVDVAVGGVARVPVNVLNASGIALEGLEIAVSFPQGSVASATVERTAITSDIAFYANVNAVPELAAAGRVEIAAQGSGVLRGEGRIFDLLLQLSPSVQAGSDISLTIETMSFFNALGQEIPIAGANTGAIKVGSTCREGDLNRDGVLGPDDLEIALAIAAGRVSPNSCQRRSMDLNGDARLDAADVVLLLRLVEGKPIHPDILSPKGLEPVTIEIQVGTLSGQLPGDEAAVPVVVSEAAGIAGFDISLAFTGQESNLVFNRAEVGQLAGDFTVETRLENGLVRVIGIGSEPLAPGDGEIAVLVFDVAESAPGDTPFPLALAGFELKDEFGGSFFWESETAAVGGTLIAAAVQPTPYLVVTISDECTDQPVAGASVTYNSSGSFLQQTTNPQGVSTFAFVGLDAFTLTAVSGDRQRTFAGAGVQQVLMTLPAAGAPCGAPATVAFMDDFNAIDADTDYGISLQEARNFYTNLSDSAFYAKDYDADGFLTVGELFQQTSDPLLHVADRDGDRTVSLGELLRAIQFFNARGYYCAANPGDTEDGYHPGTSGSKICKRHASDYESPGYAIGLSELLRLVQIYAFGSYNACGAGWGDDGFCL